MSQSLSLPHLPDCHIPFPLLIAMKSLIGQAQTHIDVLWAATGMLVCKFVAAHQHNVNAVASYH